MCGVLLYTNVFTNGTNNSASQQQSSSSSSSLCVVISRIVERAPSAKRNWREAQGGVHCTKHTGEMKSPQQPRQLPSPLSSPHTIFLGNNDTNSCVCVRQRCRTICSFDLMYDVPTFVRFAFVSVIQQTVRIAHAYYIVRPIILKICEIYFRQRKYYVEVLPKHDQEWNETKRNIPWDECAVECGKSTSYFHHIFCSSSQNNKNQRK